MPNDERATPVDFFDKLDSIFHFNLDACATVENCKVASFYTKEQNGLRLLWNKSTWCNPPYSRGQISLWIDKAKEERIIGHSSVLLLPADTSTKWFKSLHEKANMIYFIEGRLKFGDDGPAKFPSCLGIFGYVGANAFPNVKVFLLEVKIPGFIC